MYALPFVLAPMLLAAPDRPLDISEVTWVGKTVYPKASPLYLDLNPEPIAQAPKQGPYLNMISYRVYAERPDHIQVRTREAQVGWLRKADVVPLEDAVSFFTKQIEVNKDDLNAYNRRAAAWRAKGEQDWALKDATEALRLSKSAPLYNNRALIWQSKKEYGKALEDYAQAFAVSPQYPLGLINRATLWQATKDYDKAIADTTLAMQIQPGLPYAFRVRGVAFFSKKEYDKAIADFSLGLELEPKSAQMRTDRASVWAAKKEYAKAHDDHNEALRAEQNNVASMAAAAMWLASCPEEKYRDGKRALELARQAQKLERNNSQVLQALAAAHAELGQFKEAIRWQEHALGDLQLKSDGEAQTRLELYRKGKAYRLKQE